MGLLLTGCSNSMFNNQKPNQSSSSSISPVKAYYGFGSDSTAYGNQLAEGNQVTMPVDIVGGIYYELLVPGDVLESSLIKESFTCSGTCSVYDVKVVKNSEDVITGYIVFITNTIAEEVTLESSGVLDSSEKKLETEALIVNFAEDAPSLALNKLGGTNDASLILTPPSVGYVIQDINITSEYYICNNCVITHIGDKAPHEISITVLDISKIATVQVNEGLFKNDLIPSIKSNVVTVDLTKNAVTATVSVGVGNDYPNFYTFDSLNTTLGYDINNPVSFLYSFSGETSRLLTVADFTCTSFCSVVSVSKMSDRHTYVVEVMNTNGKEPIHINLLAGDIESYKNEEILIMSPSGPLDSVFTVNRSRPMKVH